MHNATAITTGSAIQPPNTPCIRLWIDVIFRGVENSYTRVVRLLLLVLVPFRFQASGKLQKGLPLILYSVVIFSVALLSCTLPDTTKKRLPDQVKNIEQPGNVMLYVAILFIKSEFSLFISGEMFSIDLWFRFTMHYKDGQAFFTFQIYDYK